MAEPSVGDVVLNRDEVRLLVPVISNNVTPLYRHGLRKGLRPGIPGERVAVPHRRALREEIERRPVLLRR
jgi:hypothetical protein